MKKIKLKFEFDLREADYQIDVLQNKLLQLYLRADPKFRRAFSYDYTNEFVTYLKDKVKLQEPTHLSIMGVTRSGKSSIASTIGFLLMSLYGKNFWVDYICGNSIEFLEKIKDLPKEKTQDSYFQIDEEKNYFGIGSLAKKVKLQDVANIIAKHNISTASLCPTGFSNKEAYYGLRLFGRCFKTKTCRMMLYNLQEKGRGGELPLGNIYLPIPSVILPKKLGEQFEEEYNAKKDEWIKKELMGEGDVLYEVKRKTAESFMRDSQYLSLKTKDEKTTYISAKLGSEWARGEILEIYNLTKLIEKGISFDDED